MLYMMFTVNRNSIDRLALRIERFWAEDIPLCLKYNDKIKLYKTQSNTIIYLLY